MISFDIETGPLPDAKLLLTVPKVEKSKFEVSEFDESTVKLGRLGPDKAKEKIEAARKEHAELAASSSERHEEATKKAWQDHVDRAPLSPETGLVVAVFLYSTNTKNYVVLGEKGESEQRVLKSFWAFFEKWLGSETTMIGLNIHDFDLPFLFVRSAICGVHVPSTAYSFRGKWINWNQLFQDVRVRWLAGRSYGSAKSNFATLAAAFGTDGKPDDVTGADFHRMWNGTADERAAAIEYGKGDVLQPTIWAEALGIV